MVSATVPVWEIGGVGGLEHCEVLNEQLWQESVPLAKPWVTQVLPFKFVPSHCSVPSITPLPQAAVGGGGGLEHCEVLNEQLEQESVPLAKP